ncbi:MAG TPA: hypothetical protein VM533_03825 [Fimbriiglobus sp.]|jgi:hypothetical protein|nr:hypothetical protein [Fimbriiglobus sp.]
MKRTAAMIAMLAGLGGCATPDAQQSAKPFGQTSVGREVPGVVGPEGGPVHAAGQMPTGKEGVVRADARMPAGKKSDPMIRQTAGFARVSGTGGGVHTPGLHGGLGHGGHGGADFGPGGPSPYGPMQHGLGQMMGHGGILPVPGMGPPGAVAAVGAIGAPGSGMYPPMYANQRTSIRFANPAGMDITWQGPGGSFVEPVPLQAPARYNFSQGNIYRLRISGIPNRPGKVYYPTLEVYPATPHTVTFLSHNTVPVSFTDEDIEQVNAGNLVTKVVYLPFPQFQDLVAVAGAEEVVSTRLEPGINPVDEANRRGTILAVIRIGNIDLQDPNTPAMDAPGAMLPGGPAMMAPPPGGAPILPPGAAPLPGGTPLPPPGAAPLPGGAPVVPPASTPLAPPAPRTPAPLPSGVKSPDTAGKASPSRAISIPTVK